MTPALILDCDGVLADTERDGHLVAFNKVFADEGMPPWTDREYADLVRIGGGKERLAAFLARGNVPVQGLPDDSEQRRALIAAWHRRKSDYFNELISVGAVPSRPGVRRLIREALAGGWAVAVASTSAEASVRTVLEQAVGPTVARRVSVFAGDLVARKKPAPDIYIRAVSALETDPSRCVVIEDSQIGLTAAVAAGLRTIITPSAYTRDDDFSAAALVISSLGEPSNPACVIRDCSSAAYGGLVDLGCLERLIGDFSSEARAAN